MLDYSEIFHGTPYRKKAPMPDGAWAIRYTIYATTQQATWSARLAKMSTDEALAFLRGFVHAPRPGDSSTVWPYPPASMLWEKEDGELVRPPVRKRGAPAPPTAQQPHRRTRGTPGSDEHARTMRSGASYKK